MIDLLAWLYMAAGAAAAAGFVAAVIFVLYYGLAQETKALVQEDVAPWAKEALQFRKDTKLFNQIEEYRRDFS